MDFLLDKIIKFNTLCLVGIYRGEDGDVFSVLKLKKNKAQLDVTECATYHGLEEVKQYLDKKIPVLLVVDGKGILNKKIDLKNETEADWLKNLDYKSIDFTSSSSSEIQFLSFCRKNIIEDYIAIFKETEIQVLDFYVGSAIAVLMKEVITKNSFYSNQMLLQFSGDTLMDIAKTELKEAEHYKVGETEISNFHVPLYAAAINFYIKHNSITKSFSEGNTSEEIIYKKAFEKVGTFILIGFFVLLLASYLLIQYFISANAVLNLENGYTYKSYDLIKELELQRDNKLRILNETGFSSKKFISYYCNEITKSTPADISFSDLDIYPIKKEIKKTEKVELDYKTISVKGQTYSKLVLNSWITYLRKQQWIKTLEILSIKRDKKGVTYFELKIAISNV